MMGFAGGAPLPTGALPHLQSPAGVDGVDDGDSDDLFCGGVRFKCYTLHLSSTELNIQCVPKISCSQNFEDSAGKSNFWAKVVQIGLNMSRNLVSQHHSQNYVGNTTPIVILIFQMMNQPPPTANYPRQQMQ